jgi:hypothetical protein
MNASLITAASQGCKGEGYDDISDQGHPAAKLRSAIVLGTSEEPCTVIGQDQGTAIKYAGFFPSPRLERVAPGHLVPVTSAWTSPSSWRWFDAVILEEVTGQVRLWEPNHGGGARQGRDPRPCQRPGSRAYLSAGLEGAEWWVAGPAVVRARDAEVELGEVQRFLSMHGLWESLAYIPPT